MSAKAEKPPVFRVDEAAILKGGEIAGQYLDRIGKTDLATLTKEEWTIFLTKAVGGAFIFAAGDVHGDQIPF